MGMRRSLTDPDRIVRIRTKAVAIPKVMHPSPIPGMSDESCESWFRSFGIAVDLGAFRGCVYHQWRGSVKHSAIALMLCSVWSAGYAYTTDELVKMAVE